MSSEPSESKTPVVVSLKVAELKKRGYSSAQEWLNQPGHLYIGRHNRFLNIEGSKWANPFPVQKHGREKCIEMYKDYVMDSQQLWEALDELQVKVFAKTNPEISLFLLIPLRILRIQITLTVGEKFVVLSTL